MMMIPFTIHTGGTTKFMETPTLSGMWHLQRNQNAILFILEIFFDGAFGRKKMSEIKWHSALKAQNDDKGVFSLWIFLCLTTVALSFLFGN